MKPEFKKKSIRSFVIRGGRITEGQRNAFEQWWPTFGLSLFGGTLDSTEAFQREAPLVLEVGFGMGDSLLQMAIAEPDKNFIGIEVHPPGVGRLIHLAGKAELSNLKIYMADAVDVLHDCIPHASIDRLQLYFPDPWHKKKHHKRRIVQPEFIQLVESRLKPNGRFHMATDWAHYAEYMLELMSSASGFTNTAGEYCFAPKPDYRPLTKFEARGERLGHGVWDIVFEKTE